MTAASVTEVRAVKRSTRSRPWNAQGQVAPTQRDKVVANDHRFLLQLSVGSGFRGFAFLYSAADQAPCVGLDRCVLVAFLQKDPPSRVDQPHHDY